MPRYPEYKNSGFAWLCEIPSHWGSLRTKNLFELMKRSPRDEDGVVTAFRDGEVTLRTNRRTDGFTNSLQEIGYQGVRCGDLVIHAMDAFAGAIGVSDSDGKSTPVYSVCKPREGVADSRYYARLLRHMALSGFVESLAKGIRERSTEFRWAEAGNVYLPLPPIAEQGAINTFLDRETAKIDALIAEQEKLLSLLAEKRRATISHAVTKGLNPDVPMKDSGEEWLGDVPAHWKLCRIKQLAGLITKGTTPTTIGGEFVDSGIRFIKAENVFNGVVCPTPEAYIDEETHRLLSRSALAEGDVLVVIAGATTGKSAVLSNELLPCNTNQAVAFIRPKQLEFSKLIHLWLSSSPVQDAIKLESVQSAQPNLSMEKLGNLLIPIPPTQKEAEATVVFIDTEVGRLNALTNEATRAIDLLKERRTALISAAVTGKIDVRHLAN